MSPRKSDLLTRGKRRHRIPPPVEDAGVARNKERCRCGHGRGSHSFAREDDFACEVKGCGCNGWSPS